MSDDARFPDLLSLKNDDGKVAIYYDCRDDREAMLSFTDDGGVITSVFKLPFWVGLALSGATKDQKRKADAHELILSELREAFHANPEAFAGDGILAATNRLVREYERRGADVSDLHTENKTLQREIAELKKPRRTSITLTIDPASLDALREIMEGNADE